MTARYISLMTLLLGLAACQSEPSGDRTGAQASAEKVAEPSYYEAEIAPIFARNCATCHLTGEEAGKMTLVPGRAIESLVGVHAIGAPEAARVVPGDPDFSYLVMKLEGTHLEHGGSGAQMPFNAPPLPPTDIAKIRNWIAAGAKR